jgi:O-antigen ligase
MKQGDAAVHLGGAAGFMLLGLHQISSRQSQTLSPVKEWVLWIAWLAGYLVVATGNRGGLLAALLAILVVLLVRPLSEWRKVALKVLLIGGALTAIFFALDLNIEVRDTPRKVSPQQLLANLQSIAGSGPQEQLEGTKDWRLNWWNDIVDYTLFGEYFWKGKGFGVNLADDDGYQVSAGTPLRSPHNGHLTILARAGMPGLLLWILLQGTFAVSMLRAYVHARRAGREWWARVDLWILSYWLAFMVNTSFDVFLEGPQGGIWFWSVFGFGLAVLEEQRSRQVALDRQRI